MNIAGLLDAALKNAGLPVIGVSVGDPANRATWQAQLATSATSAQQTAAANLIATLTLDAALEAAQNQKDAQAQIDQIPLYLKAIVLTFLDQINVVRAALPTPLPAITSAQMFTAIKNKAGQ